MLSFSDFFEQHCGPQGFQSCKNTNYKRVQFSGSSFFMRASEMIAISKSTCSEALTIYSNSYEGSVCAPMEAYAK